MVSPHAVAIESRALMYAEIMCNEDDTDTDDDCCFQFNQLYADLNDQENDVSLVLNRRCTFKRASNSVSSLL